MAGPWATCDRSGFCVPHSETVLEWTGLRVWRRFADPRHPQDTPVMRMEDTAVKDPRPEPEDVYQVGRVLPSDL